MSQIVASESSFEQLVDNIKLGSRSSRTNSTADSTYGGSNESTPQKTDLVSPRDSGIWLDGPSDSPTSQKHDSLPSSPGRGAQQVAQHHLFHTPRRIDSHHLRDLNHSPSFGQQRERSGSVASSAKSDDSASNKFALWHSRERKGTMRDDHGRPIVMSRKLEDPVPELEAIPMSPARPGCILHSVGAMQSLRGTTTSGLPMWWCKFDKMVVLDGMLKDDDTGDMIPMTRSSKGLPIANRKGSIEVVRLHLDCDHCKDILRVEGSWKYAARVCSRSVCTACKHRCRQEYERSQREQTSPEVEPTATATEEPPKSIVEEPHKSTVEELPESIVEEPHISTVEEPPKSTVEEPPVESSELTVPEPLQQVAQLDGTITQIPTLVPENDAESEGQIQSLKLVYHLVEKDLDQIAQSEDAHLLPRENIAPSGHIAQSEDTIASEHTPLLHEGEGDSGADVEIREEILKQDDKGRCKTN
ncbi:hypothetical protein BT63DRAFT_420853 [Microthyrium microscopicum]|uniref:Uncharacterized protein n=1 Tax=Microthyrium microscopicum TaxID=703497 RepID=A0A6A6UNI0_9PEZI|nr:hypothetical protein BT63DRAFT_420853 [Microthyrium microscopicum]